MLQRKTPAGLARHAERAHAGLLQVRVDGANGLVRDHVDRTGDRKRRDRRAAGERFQLHHAEGVGEAREHEHVGGRHMGRKVATGLFPQEFDRGITAGKLGPLRSIPDHDLGAGQLQREKCLEIFFHRDAADIHEDRSRQIELGHVVGGEEVGIDPAAPGAESAEAARRQLFPERLGRHHRHRAGCVKAPEHFVAPGDRDDGTHSDVFGKACRIGRRELQLPAAAIGAHGPSDRAFGCDVNGVGGRGFDSARDFPLVRQRNPQSRIRRHAHRRKAVGDKELNPGAKRRCARGQRRQRADDAVHLGMPCVGRDQDPHDRHSSRCFLIPIRAGLAKYISGV